MHRNTVLAPFTDFSSNLLPIYEGVLVTLPIILLFHSQMLLVCFLIDTITRMYCLQKVSTIVFCVLKYPDRAEKLRVSPFLVGLLCGSGIVSVDLVTSMEGLVG